MKRLIAVQCLSLAVLLAASPLPADAGTKNLWPSQFTLSAINQSIADAEAKAMRNFNQLMAINGCAIYESEVRLPVGTRITRFAVSASISGEGSVVADLLFSSVGGSANYAAGLSLSGDNNHDWYYAPYINSSRVYPSHKYWVLLNICGSAYVDGVQVSYR